ncbi:MAG: lipoate--protein ligase family protein [Verrucomicrobia bacterium]|nr:lipoate--protein ligase family protein [Verrucomicrobiota bacterium]MBS0645393.1 lipoate--protein ligase family protein [Verrucomicrobiota bacterium]
MFSLLILHQTPIFEQLQLEEALLRTDQGNWCIINTGAPDAIVMGISGKAEQLLNYEEVHRRGVPIVRRYSGGGTVYIDSQTIFVTLLGNGEQTPRPLLELGHRLYAPVFPKNFELLENDYVIGDLKIGGNAQYLQRQRWVHHTSFLWDYDQEKMQCLTLPQRRPAYRAQRKHHEFLTTLSSHFPDKQQWIQDLVLHLQQVLPAEIVYIHPQTILTRPHRKGTCWVEL